MSTFVLVCVLLSACSNHDRRSSDAIQRGDAGVISHAPQDDAGSANAGASADVDARISDELPACVTSAESAQQVPVDMYIMLDRSGSMLELTGAGPSKWDAIREALTTFVQDPRSAGLGVGLQYFPLPVEGVPDSCDTDEVCGAEGGACLNRACKPPASGSIDFALCVTSEDCPFESGGCVFYGICENDTTLACFDLGPTGCGAMGACVPAVGQCLHYATCDTAEYATPAVRIGSLPGRAAAIVSSLNSETPVGLTPTSAALSGAIDAARARAVAEPKHRVIAVLATDGTPTDCAPVDTASITSIARMGLLQSPSIQSYVIGVFGPSDVGALANLDSWANAGGSAQAFVVDPGTDVNAQFLDALEKIRAGSLACEFLLPPSPEGDELDLGRVNVALVDATGTRSLRYVQDEQHCGDAQLGWHYDADPDSGKPTKINVCKSSCDALRAAIDAHIELRLGCLRMGPD